MLRSLKDIIGYPISALDGEIGKVKDCLFDDRHWRLRYLTVNTGTILSRKQVLISPLHAEQPDTGWSGRTFPVSLTRKQIENSPQLEEDAPVSHRYEEEFARYYRMTNPYWAGPFAWGGVDHPIPLGPLESGASEQELRERNASLKRIADCHLRSAKEIIGYRIEANDKSFGQVADFIMDVDTWRLHYLVLDSRAWLPGKKSLVDIGWVENFDWSEQSAKIDLSKAQIEHAPEYDPRKPVNRGYEKQLCDYYGRPCYWEEPLVTPF